MVALASSLLVLSRQQEALALLHRAKTLAPADPEIYVTLGFALRSVRDLPGAEAAWQRALELDPECSAAQVNQAMTRAEAGDLDEAARLLDAALAREPGLSRAGVAKAYLHLLRGDFESGWQQLERRLELPVASMKPKAPPRWQGEPLLGHRILVEAEEGFGDTLQFVRYLPLLMAQGAKVTLRAPKPLLKLLRQSFRDVIVVAEGDAAPHADVRIELLSLPLRFGTRLDSIPREIPYLSVGQEALARWQAILGEDNGLRVGVVWAGNPRQTNDCNRSMPVEYLGTLAAIPGVTLYSLMVGPRGRDLARLSLSTVIDLTPRLSDFSETAAAISVLDLVVTVCTSAAHLTGALGRPGYVLLSTAADWRWLRERADSPWYPSLKLIRQITPGDWSAPIATIAGHLRDHAGQHKV